MKFEKPPAIPNLWYSPTVTQSTRYTVEVAGYLEIFDSLADALAWWREVTEGLL